MSAVPDLLTESRGKASQDYLFKGKKLRKGNPVDLRPALRRYPLVCPDGVVTKESFTPDEVLECYWDVALMYIEEELGRELSEAEAEITAEDFIRTFREPLADLCEAEAIAITKYAMEMPVNTTPPRVWTQLNQSQ